MAGGSFFLAANSALMKSGALPTPGSWSVWVIKSVVVTVRVLGLRQPCPFPSVRESVWIALATLCACGRGLLFLQDRLDLRLHFIQRLQSRLLLGFHVNDVEPVAGANDPGRLSHGSAERSLLELGHGASAGERRQQARHPWRFPDPRNTSWPGRRNSLPPFNCLSMSSALARAASTAF